MKTKYYITLDISTENENLIYFKTGGIIRGKVPCLIASLKTISRRIFKEIWIQVNKDPTALDDPKTSQEVNKIFGHELEKLINKNIDEVP